MALNPEFQAKFREEIDELLKEKGVMVLNFDDVQGGEVFGALHYSQNNTLIPTHFLVHETTTVPVELGYEINS